MTEAVKGESGLSNVVDITSRIKSNNNEKMNAQPYVSGGEYDLEPTIKMIYKNSEEDDYEESNDKKIDEVLDKQNKNVFDIENLGYLFSRFRKKEKKEKDPDFRGEEEF